MTAAGLITGAVLALALLGRELADTAGASSPGLRRRLANAGLGLLAVAFATLTVVRIVDYL